MHKKIEQLQKINILQDILIVPSKEEEEEALKAIESITEDISPPIQFEEWMEFGQDFPNTEFYHQQDMVTELPQTDANLEPITKKETTREERWNLVKGQLAEFDNLLQCANAQLLEHQEQVNECKKLVTVLNNRKRNILETFKLENETNEIKKKL